MKRLTGLLMLLFGLSSIAYSDIAVIVSQTSTLTTIDKMGLSDIYLERVHTFENGSLVVPLNNRNLKNDFYIDVTGRDSFDLQTYWSDMLFTCHGQPPTTLDNDASILSLVANNPNMIGYVNASSIVNRTDVRVVYTIQQKTNASP